MDFTQYTIIVCLVVDSLILGKFIYNSDVYTALIPVYQGAGVFGTVTFLLVCCVQ